MNRQGQSIIEYSLIAVLVVLGIVTMGPYVLRSVGAHFKIWDDGVKDSFEESLNQAPVNDVPIINIPCVCTTTDDGCGSALAGTQCQDPTKHGYTITCTPVGCNNDPYSWCELDPGSPGHPGCCTTPTNYNCGDVPLPTNASGNVDTSLEIPLPNPANPPPTGQSNNGTYNNNCYFGDEIQHFQCGGNTDYQCVDGSQDGCGQPGCQGNPSTGVLFCATGTNQPPTGLNTNYTIGNPVANQTACPQNPACQTYCDTSAGYTINAAGTGCAKQCPAGPLPSSVIISTDANPSPMTLPPVGMNYYFFNFNTQGNGIFTQTVSPSSGAVTPGQTYHLKLVSGRDPGDNHCIGNICDGDIVENDPGLLHIVVGDQTPGGQSNYDWQILDANNNVVFEWSGLIDYSLDVAFTPLSCPTIISCEYDANGTASALTNATWNGYYADSCAVHADNNDEGNSYGDAFVTISCNSSSQLAGVCVTSDSNKNDAHDVGFNNDFGCNASNTAPLVGCSWNGAQTYYWQLNGQNGNNSWDSSCYMNNSNNPPAPCPLNGGDPRIAACTNSSFTMTCNSNQLTSLVVNNLTPFGLSPLTPAANNGCNWNGQVSLGGFNFGNISWWVCSPDQSGNGVLTKVIVEQNNQSP